MPTSLPPAARHDRKYKRLVTGRRWTMGAVLLKTQRDDPLRGMAASCA
jgi:hypothetical protein